MIRYATIGFFVSLLTLSTTYKRYKESREKVWDVQRRVEWFMKRFRDLFTGTPPSSFKTKESISQAVSVMIVSAVKNALINGVAFGDTESLRLVLINLVEHANAVGFERNWETYIGDVAKKLDTYECFNWQI